MKMTPDQRYAKLSFDATGIVNGYISGEGYAALKGVPEELGIIRAIKGLMLRAIWLVQGISILDRVAHLQLILAANRAMLEILVDLILLSSNEPEEAIERLEAWELSARYKAASATIEYVTGEHGATTELEQSLVEFVQRERDHVGELRRRFWPDKNGKAKHPDRWTGRNLLLDVQEADRLSSGSLERFYQTEYRRMNWQVHGSTLAGFRGLDMTALRAWFGLGHKKTSEFALDAMQVTLTRLGVFQGANRDALENAKLAWAATLAESL